MKINTSHYHGSGRYQTTPVIFFLFFLITALPALSFASTKVDKSDVMKKVSGLQVPFVENQGQIKDRSVRFYANTFAGTVYVTDKGELIYDLPKRESNKQEQEGKVENTADKRDKHFDSSTKSVALRETFSGLKKADVRGVNRSITQVNYFKGNEDSWKSNVQTWQDVSLGEVYDNIDLSLRAYGNNVEKLFTVHPQGSVKDILMTIKGATGLGVNDKGELEVETALGTIKMTKPIAYQEVGGNRTDVAVSYLVADSDLVYGFNIGDYDSSKDLIIDPLLASTFLGGSSYEYANSIAIDSSGNVYITGHTSSSSYPTTTGAYNTVKNSNYDVLVSKIDSSLSNLLASTFIGGSNYEYANSIAIDSSGDVYVTGLTYSSNYPATTGAYDTSHNGGRDVFVSKMDSSLTSLLASTLIGGSSWDEANSIAINSSGNVYITGEASSGYPATTGAYDTSHSGGTEVFMSKLDSSLTSLLASTFIGGSGNMENANAIAIDSSGNIYITGFTGSSDYPTTSGGYDTSYNNGGDVFVSKVNSSLSSLLASTFIGGLSDDQANALSIDSAGDVYITGFTKSASYPTTSGAYDTSINGLRSVFVSKIDSSLSSLLASTFIGGLSDDQANALSIASAGDVYITGFTKSESYPTTSGAYDTSHNGVKDLFVTMIDNTLSNLLASTFIGGMSDDQANALAIASSGDVYITGITYSSDYPATAGAYDTSRNGSRGSDVIVTKINFNLTDNDGDGYSENQGDCDDTDPAVNPGALEVCDGIDNNCNGSIDELSTDVDDDGYSPCGGDCDDSDPAVNPGETEIPYNGKDDDCNAATLDDDLDSDGYPTATDCDDNNASINPGAVETCDGIDNNCDGNIDEGLTDADSDGYSICTGDCNDNDTTINPGEPEIPYNDKDDDCDSATSDYVWSFENIDNTGNVVQYISTVMDSSDIAHISYYDATNDNLKYATNETGSWVTETVDSTGNVGQYTSIAIDSSGIIHISYYDVTNGNLKHAKKSSGPWVTDIADSAGNVGQYTSIAIDSLDVIHVSYYDVTNGDLKYAKKSSAPWTTELVDYPEDAGKYSSIAIDSSDNVHISYHDVTNTNLKYAKNTTGSWYRTTVDDGDYAGLRTSIAIDSADVVHISYYYSDPIALRHATIPGSIETVESCDDFSNLTTLITSLNKVKITYMSWCYGVGASLNHTSKPSGVWMTERVDISSGGGTSSSAIDLLDYVHIAYYDSSEQILKYVTNRSKDVDYDGDSYNETQGDCNENDSLINPGEIEICDGRDNNCDGTIDEGFVDADSDGYKECFDDCNDSDPAVNPGESEIAYNGKDDDCNAATPDDDLDSDSYPGASDCDDYDSSVNPGAVEICDGIDNNCNGNIDENFTDADGDGYAACYDDCDDSVYSTNPGAPEICDGIDNNCDGSIDEGFTDADSDGYAACNGDCNESDPAINPRAPEICDGIDNNCDGYTDGIDIDVDGDGYTVCGGDCVDLDLAVNPGMTEVFNNGKDDDCDATTPDYQQFYSEVVAATGSTSNVIGIDSSGNTHIYYCDNGQTRHVLRSSSGSLSASLVADVCGNMAIDSAGKVHVSFYVAGEGQKHGTNSSGAWTSTLASSYGGGGPIDVDSSGNVHMTYYFSSSHQKRIEYITNTSGAWVTENIALCNYDDIYGWQDCYILGPTGIAAASSGKAHIVFKSIGEESDYFMHSTNSSGAWSSSSVASYRRDLYHNIYYSDINVDSSDNAHFSYMLTASTTQSKELKHYSTATGTESITADCVGSSEIVTDMSGNAHIAYCDVNYATNRTGSLISENVDTLASSSGKSIAVDSAGYVHISYYSSGNLMYATNAPQDDYDADGYSELQGDCDDDNASVSPEAVEIWYDGVDQNCDGWNDYDQDMDGYVDTAWNAKAGGTSPGIDDCDDGNSALNPQTYWYPDSDGDGYGNPTILLQQCTQPAGYVLDNTDCDDSDPGIGAGALPARVLGVTTDYYATLLDAYSAAADGETIQCREITYSGGMDFNLAKDVTIQGGYNCGYTGIDGTTDIIGGVTINNGTVTMENIVIE